MTQVTDRIEKKVMLAAPLARVWRALTEAQQFGAWFGVEFEGDFVAGRPLAGKMIPTQVDAEVAKSQEPYAGLEFVILVERIEPMRLFSFKWNPYEIEPGLDPLCEPMTLVTFMLEEAAGGTMLTITESGFDGVPLEKRAQAFASNEQGWTIQCRLIEKYLTSAQS